MPVTVRCPNRACSTTSIHDDTIISAFRCPACGKTATLRPTDKSDLPVQPAAGTRALPAAIGRFQIRGRLGAGAFGTVYRAYDPQLDREVALKVPNANVLDAPTRVERFLREAKAAANLRHPHIVPVYDAGREGGSYFIAAAFIDGQTLEASLDNAGLAFDRAARLTRELAEALAYAHEQGIVHRDVKPSNIMLDAHDRIHLMDFGLAARQAEESRITNDGAILGTPGYMAPEQARGDHGETGPAADQYSAGVVLYELLTGELPYDGSAAVVIHNVINTLPEPPRTRRPEVPKDLETICLKVLAKNPVERYPTCQAFADDLRRWQEREPITARRQGPVERLTRAVRRNKVLASVALLAAVFLLAGVVVSSLLALRATAAARLARDESTRAKLEAGRADREAETAKTAQAAAVANEAKANQSTADEREQRRVADAAKATAVDEQRKTAKALEDLQQARSSLNVAAVQVQTANYKGYIKQADEHLQNKDLVQTRRALDLCAAGDRGWEWNYLSLGLSRGQPACLTTVLPVKFLAAALSEDLQYVVGIDEKGKVQCYHAGSAELMWEAPLFEKIAQQISNTRQPAIVSIGGDYVAAHLSSQIHDPVAKKNLFDGATVIYHLKTGKKIHALTIPDMKLSVLLTSLIVSPDGRHVATAGAVWSTETGAVTGRFAGKTCLRFIGQTAVECTVDSASLGQFRIDGSLVSASSGVPYEVAYSASTLAYSVYVENAKVKSNDVNMQVQKEGGSTVFALNAHLSPPAAFALISVNNRLATAAADGTVRLWSLDSGLEMLTLKTTSAKPLALRSTANGKTLCAIYEDGTVAHWTNDDMHFHQTITGDSGVAKTAWSHDGKLLAIDYLNSKDRWSNLHSTCLYEWPGLQRIKFHDGKGGIAFHPTKNMYALGSAAGIETYNSFTHQRMNGSPALIGGVDELAFLAGTDRIFCVASELRDPKRARSAETVVWDASQTDKAGFITSSKYSYARNVSTYARKAGVAYVSTTQSNSKVQINDPVTHDSIWHVEHPKAVSFFTFNKNGSRLATSCADNNIRIWDVETHKILRTYPNVGGHVFALAISPDDQWLACVIGGSLKLYRLKESETSPPLIGPPASGNHITFSPDGQSLLVGGASGVTKIWDMAKIWNEPPSP